MTDGGHSVAELCEMASLKDSDFRNIKKTRCNAGYLLHPDALSQWPPRWHTIGSIYKRGCAKGTFDMQ